MERTPMERALSTDLVVDIVMKHLKDRDLLNCRQVSKCWNTAASSVLRRRSTLIKNISKQESLKELEECLKQSSDFPFAGLKFMEPWKLSSAGAVEFFKNYGARFTRIRVGTSWETKLQDVAPILNHLPRLSILETGSSYGVPPPAELSDSAAGHADDGRILNLPSLRIVRISSGLNEDVLREVCTAASPSLRIECLSDTYGILRALESAGKLQAVSVLNVEELEDEKDYPLMMDKLLSTGTPALIKLNFSADGCISRNGLMKLIISSQHTLKELCLAGICPSDFLSECPVLAKLTTLSLCIERTCEYVFQGSHGHKFPVLKELKLDTTWDFRISNFSDGLFIVPSVARMDVDGYFSEDDMEELAQTFPNVVEIGLQYGHYSSYDSEETWKNPFLIWSVREFEHLEKLRIWNFRVLRPRPAKNDLNMDSFLTGIPLSIRQNLQKHKRELMLNLVKSPFGEKFSEVLRESPNILKLKNLKELLVCVKLEHALEELPEEPPFMSMVSVWYTLEMMPNLQAKFVYDYFSPSWRFKEKHRDKAVTTLQAAFKHVQPHVELEPFFY